MIIYGWKQYVKVLAVLQLVCVQCGNRAEHVLRGFTTKFTLFWIPLFPINKKRTLFCTACECEQKIPKEQALALAAGQGGPQPFGPQPGQMPGPMPGNPASGPQPAFGPPAGPNPAFGPPPGPNPAFGPQPVPVPPPGYGPPPGPPPGFQGPPPGYPPPGQPFPPQPYPPQGYPPPGYPQR